jgi:ssDNA thymidine ADP-ribosyltransferase, DarT
MPQPDSPKIYHIVHMDRLESIASDGFLWSDKEILSRTVGGTTIGMSKIKERRLRLPVKCHSGTTVGEFIPFYYCPRSIMLYLIHMRHPDVAFKDGQESIVHLEFDLNQVINWANTHRRLWAIALSNAGAVYTEFRKDVTGLAEVNWNAVNNTDFRTTEVKEGKQAEFLVYQAVPWTLVEHVGVCNGRIQRQVQNLLERFEHQPTTEVRNDWYY